MKAHVTKKEKKKMFGRSKFEVETQIELEPEEEASFKKYKLGELQFIAWDFVESLPGDRQQYWDVLSKARCNVGKNERTFDDLALASNFESAFYAGCKHLKEQIEAAEDAASGLGESTTMEF